MSADWPAVTGGRPSMGFDNVKSVLWFRAVVGLSTPGLSAPRWLGLPVTLASAGRGRACPLGLHSSGWAGTADAGIVPRAVDDHPVIRCCSDRVPGISSRPS